MSTETTPTSDPLGHYECPEHGPVPPFDVRYGSHDLNGECRRQVMWTPSGPGLRDISAAMARATGCDACRVVGPLLTAPGASGRPWRCECGTVWPLLQHVP